MFLCEGTTALVFWWWLGPVKERDIAAPAHLGALVAARPRIQAMMQDVLTAGLLPKQPLETRLAAVMETATSTYLEALGGEDRDAAKLYVQKAAQAADEAWQQAVDGHNGPVGTNPTVSELEHPSSAPQDDDSNDMDFSSTPRKSRLSAPQLQAQLSWLSDRIRLRRLKNALRSKGAWQQVPRREDLCHTHVSHKWLYHLDACAGSVLTPRDCITNVQKRLGNREWTSFGQCRFCGSFLDPQVEHGETCSTVEATRGHFACVHAVLGGLKLADPSISTEPRGLTATQSRAADLSLPLLSQDAVRPWVCAASPNAAAARGDAQAAFDRKLSDYRHQVPDLRNQGIHHRPLVWTADGRPHPAVTRTLQHAADIASSRNGQQMSAKLHQHRWKHEIQMSSFAGEQP